MSGLTEEQKLVKLGLRSPNQTESSLTETKATLQSNIAEEWSAFQTAFEDANLGSWSDFETWLEDNGISASAASNIRSKFENKYATFSDFKTAIIDEYESWSDFENDFATNTGLRSTRQTDTGLSAAGIKVYEESGVGRDGQSIAAGGVEIYGAEIHTSNTDTVRDTDEEAAGTDDPIVYSNLTLSQTSHRVGDTVTVSADLEHNTPFAGNVVAEFIIGGTVEDTKTIELTGNDSLTVSFDYAGRRGTGTFDVSIADLPPQELTTLYSGL